MTQNYSTLYKNKRKQIHTIVNHFVFARLDFLTKKYESLILIKMTKWVIDLCCYNHYYTILLLIECWVSIINMIIKYDSPLTFHGFFHQETALLSKNEHVFNNLKLIGFFCMFVNFVFSRFFDHSANLRCLNTILVLGQNIMYIKLGWFFQFNNKQAIRVCDLYKSMSNC